MAHWLRDACITLLLLTQKHWITHSQELYDAYSLLSSGRWSWHSYGRANTLTHRFVKIWHFVQYDILLGRISPLLNYSRCRPHQSGFTTGRSTVARTVHDSSWDEPLEVTAFRQICWSKLQNHQVSHWTNFLPIYGLLGEFHRNGKKVSLYYCIKAKASCLERWRRLADSAADGVCVVCWQIDDWSRRASVRIMCRWRTC